MSKHLTFDSASHTYRMLGGVVVPSVTQVLGPVFHDFSKVPKDVLQSAQERGTLAHEATALDAHGRLDESTVDDDIKPYLEAWRAFMADSFARVVATEQRVYHALYGYAGTLDHVLLLSGVLTIIDKKTGQPHDADRMQTAAYLDAYNYALRPAARVRRRAALYLRPTGQYALEYHNDKADFQDFLSALNVHKRKMR